MLTASDKEPLVLASSWHRDELVLELEGQEPLLLIPGREIALQVSAYRSCIGYRKGAVHHPCPDRRERLSGSQCDGCFELSGILPCLRCTGSVCRNRARRGRCVQPRNHALYLASFGRGIIKVGVARWERRYQRLAEQGARTALIVARDDGQTIRASEANVKAFGIDDRLSAREKLALTTDKTEPANLRVEIVETLRHLRHWAHAAWLDEPEAMRLPAWPTYEHPPELPRVAGMSVRGEIDATVGKLTIVRTDTGTLTAIDTQALVGFKLSPLPAGSGTSGQIQLALA